MRLGKQGGFQDERVFASFVLLCLWLLQKCHLLQKALWAA